MRNIPPSPDIHDIDTDVTCDLKSRRAILVIEKYQICSTFLFCSLLSHSRSLIANHPQKTKNKLRYIHVGLKVLRSHTGGGGGGSPHVVQDSQESPLLYFLTNLNTRDRINILELLCLPDSSFHEKHTKYA